MSTIEQKLKDALSKDRRIAAWEIQSSRSSEAQLYLSGARLTSERRVERESCSARVHVLHDDVQGQSALRFQAGEEAGIPARLDEAVYMAGLGGDPPYALAGLAVLPDVPLEDPELSSERALETGRNLAAVWTQALSGAQGIRPSSAEIFAEETESAFETSAGFRGAGRQTHLSVLSVILSQDGDREAERIPWEERRRASDLDLGSLVDRAVNEARDLLRAELPPSGVFPVVIDCDEFTRLFQPIQFHSSAEALFQQQSRFETGAPILPGPIEGDALTLVSNAISPYGLASYRFDDSGVPGQRLEVVKDGVFTRAWATRQFGQYLKLDPTGEFGNLEIAPGQTGFDALLENGPVVWVRSFSWLSPDFGRGDWSSEIRIGYLVDKNGRRPIKGGSVSGNLFRDLSRARFTRETTTRGNYLGPIAVRFEGLNVSGA